MTAQAADRLPPPALEPGDVAEKMDGVLRRVTGDAGRQDAYLPSPCVQNHAANLARLATAFDPARMDALLLLAATATSIGYAGRGDYRMLADGRLVRRGERDVVPFVYAGAAILAPALFADAPEGAFSLTRLFDRAAERERLFGLRLEGVWMHVGTPDAIAAAERALLASVA